MGDLLLTRSGDMGACRNALCRQAICGTTDKHIVFGFHGYPWPVHRLTYRRTNRNLHVRGYEEEGTITTPFDMRVQTTSTAFV